MARFIIKPALMLYKTLEVELDGQPIYISLAAARLAFELRPTSVSRPTVIITEVIARAVRQDIELNNLELQNEVQAHPDIWDLSARKIMKLARPLKPKAWMRPGRRRRS